MGADMPKQFLEIAGKPILVHTLERFRRYRVVLVLPDSQIPYWKSLWHRYRLDDCEPIVVVGGATRTQSVRNGLSRVPDDCLVAIHDGVRPLVSAQLIEQCYASAEQYGSGIAATDCTDSLRCNGKAVDRSIYRLMQTPQTFRSTELRQAYQQICADNADNGTLPYTDDAMVYEAAGHELHFVRGERTNIKITLPVDLKIAQALLND